MWSKIKSNTCNISLSDKRAFDELNSMGDLIVVVIVDKRRMMIAVSYSSMLVEQLEGDRNM